MSNLTSSLINTSPLFQSAINSVSNTGANGSYATTSTNSYNAGSVFKAQPAFKMEMYKSENGGFVMNLITNSTHYNEDAKIFILNDIENLGKDIQNILIAEILKA